MEKLNSETNIRHFTHVCQFWRNMNVFEDFGCTLPPDVDGPGLLEKNQFVHRKMLMKSD